VKGEGTIRVELSRPGLPVVHDERNFVIVNPPPAKTDKKPVTLPPFDFRGIDPDHPMWDALDWPEDISAVASAAVTEEGLHVVYYSTVFPKFKAQYDALERRDPAKAKSFEARYRIWITVHSLLQHYQQQKAATAEQQHDNSELDSRHEREERVRVATLAAMFAAKEIESPDSEGVEID
jgi:hypothetical protein